MASPMGPNDVRNQVQDRGTDAGSPDRSLVLSLQNGVQSVTECLKNIATLGQQSRSDGLGLAAAFLENVPTLQKHTLNQMISAQVGRAGPRLVNPGENGEVHSAFLPSWTDVIMAKQAGKVKGGENGVYRSLVENQLVEWDEAEDRFLRPLQRTPLPLSEDIKTEETFRSDILARFDQIMSDVYHFTNLAREAIEKIQPLTFRHPDDPAVSTKSRESLAPPQKNITENHKSDETKDEMDRIRLPSEESDSSMRSNAMSANSILLNDRGDVGFTRDDASGLNKVADNRRVSGISSQDASPLPTQKPEMDGSTPQKRVRMTFEEKRDGPEFLSDRLLRGMDMEEILPQYNEEFRRKDPRSLDDLEKICRKLFPGQRGGLRKRKALVATPGRPEPSKRISQASTSPMSSIETMTVSPSTWTSFVPLAPIPPESAHDVPVSGA